MPSLPLAASPQLTSLLNVAAQLLKADRPDEAIAPLNQAAQLKPTDARILHDLGLACLEVGRLPEAIAILQRSIANKPGYADAHFRLGIALEKSGDMRGAIAAYHHTTELAPKLTEAWFRAGALVYTLGHRHEAIECFQRAAASAPKSRFGRLAKARALLTEDKDTQAEKALRETLILDPDSAMAHDLLGNLLTEHGRFEEAYGHLERAIGLAPLLSGSYYDLVRCRRVTAEDDLLPKMTAALDTPQLEAAQRLRLHLAIGKAADDLGEYERAMQHFDAADHVRRASVSFSAAAFERETARIIGECTRELMEKAPKLGVDDARPVFIVGMPRSGTTLLEQIISSHPDAAAGGELNFWNERGPVWHRLGAQGNEAPFLRSAAEDYLKLVKSLAPKALRLTDKMPFNFLWAGLIHLALPQALIIHCRRDALDTALSIHQTHFHPSLAFPTGGSDLVTYMRCYQRLSAHWRQVLPQDRFIEIEYEALTASPEAAIRGIIAACHLPWHQGCLHPENNPRSVKTPSKWQTRQPINRGSVARWRRYEPWLGALKDLREQ